MPRVLTASWLLMMIAGGFSAGAQQSQTPEDLLAEARRLYEGLNYEGAAAQADRIVSLLEPRAPAEQAVRPLLAATYELRGRARFLTRDRSGAATDFQALLRLQPTYQLTGSASPPLQQLFEETRRQTVGQLTVSVTPSDAEVLIDNTPAAEPGTPLSLVAGTYRVTAQRAGYAPATQTVTVSAGTFVPVTLTMERTSASLALVTSPEGVEVYVDDVKRGETKAGTPPPNAAEIAARLTVPIAALSERFVIPDLTLGTHRFVFQRPCYTTREMPLSVPKLADYAESVKLEPAIGSITVETTTTGATVLLDDQPHGTAPLTMDKICEGPYTLEVRSPVGRYVKRLDLRTGDKHTIRADLKPSFAILSTSGLPQGFRGARDVRVVVEQRLASTTQTGLFAPSTIRAEQALKGQALTSGWLAFDLARRPLTEDAKNIAAGARKDLSRLLSQALESQGVAGVHILPGPTQSNVLLTLLAAGSGVPDVIELDLEDPPSLLRAVAQLDAITPLYRPSIGLLAIDTAGSGVVIARVDRGGPAAAAGILPGDIVTTVSGKPIKDVAALTGMLDAAADGRVVLQWRDRAGATRSADVAVQQIPRALAQADRTLLFNKVLVELRNRLATREQTDDAVIRLNIAVALMRLENWEDARSELSRVKLPDGTGVGDGTVKYLLGLCHQALGQFVEAQQAWVAARGSEALLTEDGPPVKGLAEERLLELNRGRTGN